MVLTALFRHSMEVYWFQKMRLGHKTSFKSTFKFELDKCSQEDRSVSVTHEMSSKRNHVSPSEWAAGVLTLNMIRAAHSTNFWQTESRQMVLTWKCKVSHYLSFYFPNKIKGQWHFLTTRWRQRAIFGACVQHPKGEFDSKYWEIRFDNCVHYVIVTPNK